MSQSKIHSFSPKAFLRSRRPERFSDSEVEVPKLARDILELRLANLTSHNMDTEFERFALRLAQKTICPNLRPQTGPTGGGDAKVDTETYPVDESLALTWHVGVNAANERWAFAFSAKEEWRSKVRSDIKKLAQTGRGYTKAFFISNQAIKAKDSADMEDELRKEHGIEVWIHSRDWILDKVFTDHLEELAVTELGIELGSSGSRRLGPNDAKRQVELEELESAITRCAQEGSQGPKFVNDCLEAADLARALELPRTQLDGLFARAKRAVKQYGTKHQQIEVAYQSAWTAFNWHEEFPEFCELYSEVEALVLDSDNCSELQLLNNLWFLLFGVASIQAAKPELIQLQKRTISLANSLKRVAALTDMPTAALRAKIMLLIQQATFLFPNVPDSIFDDLLRAVKQTEGLIGYPFEPLSAIIDQIGRVFSDDPRYDTLFEVTCELLTRRKGDTAKGMMLLNRGFTLYDAEKYLETIAVVGRSLYCLAKEETLDAEVVALRLCGSAYQQIGLLWAARGSLLNAASIMASRFHDSSDTRFIKPELFVGLKWCELQLGRLSQLLAWHDTELQLRSVFDGPEIDWSEGDIQFDATLGILLQRANLDQLRQLSRLPAALDDHGLICARLALLYMLGQDDPGFKNLLRNTKDDIDSIFSEWRSQPAAKEISGCVVLGTEPVTNMSTRIQGCTVVLTLPDNACFVLLGETILAGIEALLATGTKHEIFASEPQFQISLIEDDHTAFPFEFTLEEVAGRPAIKVKCPDFNPFQIPRDKQEQMRTKLCDLSSHVFAVVFTPSKFEEVAKKVFGEERAFERAFNFTGSLITTANVLGNSPKLRITEWINSAAHEYMPRRDEAWRRTVVEAPAKPAKASEDNSLDEDKLKQREIKTISIIRSSLWDRAKWRGAAFFYSDSNHSPPLLGLIFENREAALELFDGLMADVGRDNKDGKLRISIIRGIDRSNPYHYRILVGSSMDELWSEGIRRGAVVCRPLTMEPTTNKNLTEFLVRLSRHGSCFVIPCVFANGTGAPTPFEGHSIFIQNLNVRDAWTIGQNDPDCMGLSPEDDPILPDGETNPPVLALLEWMREKMAHQRE